MAEALRDNVVDYVCRDRAERLWQFDVRSKPACRPRLTAVRGCVLIDTRKPGHLTLRIAQGLSINPVRKAGKSWTVRSEPEKKLPLEF